MSFPDEKRPAADPEVLCGQLQRELHLLRQGEVDPEEPLLYEVYARQVRTECWRRVGAGDLAAPGELLARLAGVQSFVNAFLPEQDEPRAEAARLMHQLLVELALAARSLEPARRTARLADRSHSSAEREVLRILFAQRDRYLRRGEVHEKMRHGERQLSQVRIGQILVSLHHEGLLLRVHGTARGNPSAAFYALSEAGVEVCRELDLVDPAPEELPPLFSIPPQVTRDLLQPGVLAAPSRGFARPGGQIVTFYSYRGGLGRSLAVAHAGSLLAGKQGGDRFLLIDMDLEAPGLNEYFDVPVGTAGFEGLLADYAAQPAGERRAWLAGALEQPRYVVPARGGLRNLFLLPSASTAVAGETGGAASQLQGEVARARHRPDGRPGLPEDGFLADLRDALHASYARVLIDAPAGLSPASYASAVLLPDELVLCLRPNPSPVDNVRKVLVNFLWHVHGPEERPLTTFVFTPFPLEARDIQPDRWIEERLMPGRPGSGHHVYRIVRLYHSKEVACGRDLLGEPRGRDASFLLRQGYEDLATLIGSTLAGSDLPPRIEREISQLVSAEAGRTAREPAPHPPALASARERFAPDVLVFSSGGRAHEAVEGLAAIGRRT